MQDSEHEVYVKGDMTQQFAAFLAVLREEQTAPQSAFIAYSGPLDAAQKQELVSTLQSLAPQRLLSVTGFRLEGCGLGSREMETLWLALRNKINLETLELQGNCIDSAALQYVKELVETNKSLTSLDLSANSGTVTSPEIMEQIEELIQRNRREISDTCTTPPLSFRSRARIEEVAADTPTGIYPSPISGQKKNDSNTSSPFLSSSLASDEKGKAYGDKIPAFHPKIDPDLNSEFSAKLLSLSHRQRNVEELMAKLEDDAELMQKWLVKFEADSGEAMQTLYKHDNEILSIQDVLAAMMLWKGTVEQIMSSSSVQLQQEVTNFQMLREKVLRLHIEFERVRKSVDPAPSYPSPSDPAQAAGSEFAAKMKKRVEDLEDDQQDLIMSVRDHSSKLNLLADRTDLLHNNHNQSYNLLNNRLERFEDNGRILEDEQQWKAGIEKELHALKDQAQLLARKALNNEDCMELCYALQAQMAKDKEETAKKMAAMEQKIEELTAAQQTSAEDVRAANHIELEAQREVIHQTVEGLVSCQATIDGFTAQVKDLELKIKESGNAQEQAAAFSAAFRLNTSSRLDGLENSLAVVERTIPGTAQQVQEILTEVQSTSERLQKEGSAPISGLQESIGELSDRLHGVEAELQEAQAVARASASMQPPTDQKEHDSAACHSDHRLKALSDQLKDLGGMRGQLEALESSTASTSSEVAELYKQVELQVQLCEMQNAEFSKQQQKGSSFNSSVAHKLRALEAELERLKDTMAANNAEREAALVRRAAEEVPSPGPASFPLLDIDEDYLINEDYPGST